MFKFELPTSSVESDRSAIMFIFENVSTVPGIFLSIVLIYTSKSQSCVWLNNQPNTSSPPPQYQVHMFIYW